MSKNKFLIIILIFMVFRAYSQEIEDQFLWLDESKSEQALEWVKERNEVTLSILKKHPSFEMNYKKSLEILNSKTGLVIPQIKGKYVYNFWVDDYYKRGVWRRTEIDNFLQTSPAWEILLNLDSLSLAEGMNWDFNEAIFLCPNFDRCMVALSRGGSDVCEYREFDLERKKFVDDGFTFSGATSLDGLAWKHRDTLWVSTDFGEGSLTESGFPRQIKAWARGKPLSEAKTMFEGEKSDVNLQWRILDELNRQYIRIQRSTPDKPYHYVIENNKILKINIDADLNFTSVHLKNQFLFRVLSDWKTRNKIYMHDSYVTMDYDELFNASPKISILEDRSKLTSATVTKNYLYTTRCLNASSELNKCYFDGNRWIKEKVDTPTNGIIKLIDGDRNSDRYFFTYENFLIPKSLYFASEEEHVLKKIRSMPECFDGTRFEVTQYETKSKDGTVVPYFLIYPQDATFNGKNPTLLYGYGGFGISMEPSYNPVVGHAWLEQGGIYAVAIIRGGGEFGEQWHRAAMKEKRQHSFNDFIAIAEDLIDRNITSPRYLGIMGESNGGLLVGAVFTQRPELFNAVVCKIPLLDMKSYHKSGAGAFFISEYGNPDDPDDWDYIKKYSPYHNVLAGQKYPEVLFITSTEDDRVPPGHARKMTAKMEAMGYNEFFYETIEGGHKEAVTNHQRAILDAIIFSYLHKKLQ